jgi:hypothetical protein
MLKHLTMDILAILWFTGVVNRDIPRRKACEGAEKEKEEFGTCGKCEPCLKHQKPAADAWTAKQIRVLAELNEKFDEGFIEIVDDDQVGSPMFCCPDDNGRLASTQVLSPAQVLNRLADEVYPLIAYRPPRNLTSTGFTEDRRERLRSDYTELQKRAVSYLPRFMPRQAGETDMDTLNALELSFNAIKEETLKYIQCIYALRLVDKLVRKLHKIIMRLAQDTDLDVDYVVNEYYEDYCEARQAYQDAFRMPLVLSASLVLSAPAAPAE